VEGFGGEQERKSEVGRLAQREGQIILVDLKPTEWEGVESINIDWGRQASLNRILTLRSAQYTEYFLGPGVA
jgi:hypothetical protein